MRRRSTRRERAVWRGLRGARRRVRRAAVVNSGGAQRCVDPGLRPLVRARAAHSSRHVSTPKRVCASHSGRGARCALQRAAGRAGAAAAARCGIMSRNAEREGRTREARPRRRSGAREAAARLATRRERRCGVALPRKHADVPSAAVRRAQWRAIRRYTTHSSAHRRVIPCAARANALMRAQPRARADDAARATDRAAHQRRAYF